MKNVCFTGHRHISCSIDSLLIELDFAIEAAILKGATEFFCGGALGFDTLAAKAVLSLKEKYPCINLHLILPCNNEAQTSRWSEMNKQEFYEIIPFAENIEYISNEYTKNCMKLRNARLVELADYCICYYNEDEGRSGTGQTYRMAIKKGIEIVNLF